MNLYTQESCKAVLPEWTVLNESRGVLNQSRLQTNELKPKYSDAYKWVKEVPHGTAGMWPDRIKTKSVVFKNKIWVMGGYDGKNKIWVMSGNYGIKIASLGKNAKWISEENNFKRAGPTFFNINAAGLVTFKDRIGF